MWSNLKQKTSDELFARVTKIVNELETRNNASEIEKTFIEINKKFMAEFNTKISNEVTTCLSEINASFTAELGRVNKLTAEIENFKARDAGNATEAQKIFSKVDNVTASLTTFEGNCRNEFGRINVVIKNLQNEINQHYAVVQRTEFDQQSMTNDSEAELGNSGSTLALTNSSPSSSSSGSSNLSGILDITSDIKICFKQHFDRFMKTRNYTFDEMCFLVVVDIHSL